MGTFATTVDAEKFINKAHSEHGVLTDNVSYIYKNEDGEVENVDVEDVTEPTAVEGAEAGANIGAVAGTIAGIAAALLTLPVSAPLAAGGALATALAAVGTTAVGAATGGLGGALIGALTNLGFDVDEVEVYEDRINAGDVMVSVIDDEGRSEHLREAFINHGAANVRTYDVTVDNG